VRSALEIAIYTRMNRWAKAGVLDRLFAGPQREQLIRVKIECATARLRSIPALPISCHLLMDWMKSDSSHWISGLFSCRCTRTASSLGGSRELDISGASRSDGSSGGAPSKIRSGQ
jgi:hypothetical protein